MSGVSLSDIFRLRKAIGIVPFQDVVRQSCGHDVIPIDEDNNDDKELLRHLTFALTSFMRLAEKSGMRFRAGRINDVGKKFENVIKEEVKKTPIQIRKLGSSGYPDFEVTQEGTNRLTYLEMKATGNPKAAASTLRTFYYSSGRKVKGDARHLLVKFQMQEEENKSWKVLSWELHDLARLKVSLKPEFQAGFKDLLSTPLIDASDLPHSKRKGGEQLKLP